MSILSAGESTELTPEVGSAPQGQWPSKNIIFAADPAVREHDILAIGDQVQAPALTLSSRSTHYTLST